MLLPALASLDLSHPLQLEPGGAKTATSVSTAALKPICNLLSNVVYAQDTVFAHFDNHLRQVAERLEPAEMMWLFGPDSPIQSYHHNALLRASSDAVFSGEAGLADFILRHILSRLDSVLHGQPFAWLPPTIKMFWRLAGLGPGGRPDLELVIDYVPDVTSGIWRRVIGVVLELKLPSAVSGQEMESMVADVASGSFYVARASLGAESDWDGLHRQGGFGKDRKSESNEFKLLEQVRSRSLWMRVAAS